MPKCVVTKCPHQTGKKARYPEIVLHPFPKDIKLIQDWLRLAGMEEENLELVSFEILEDRRSDKFRMCSAHFTQDSYISKGTKRVLKGDAKPSKFPEKTVLDFAQPPMMHRIAKRARIEQSAARTGVAVKVACSCKCHARLKAKLVNASTQTESCDFLPPASVQPGQPNNQNIGTDSGFPQTIGLLGQQDSTAEEATDSTIASPLDIISIKHWEKTQLRIKQEETQNDNGFLSFKDARSILDHSSPEKSTIDSEVSSFNIVTVDSWETIKQNTRTEKEDLLYLQDTSTEGAFLHNRKGFVHTIKKEDKESENGYLNPEEADTNNDDSCLEKPGSGMLHFGPKPMKSKKETKVRIRNENPHLPEQSTSSPTDLAAEPEKRKRANAHSDLLDTSKSTDSKCSKSFTEEVASWSMEYTKEKKYVVYESCLDVLLLNMRCQQNHCSEKIRKFDKQTVGSLLVVFGTCCQGHHGKLWESQPRVNSIGAGNVLLAALLMLTGSSVKKIKELCDMIALQMFSESSLHRFEDAFIFPNVSQWMKEESETEQEDFSWDRGRSV